MTCTNRRLSARTRTRATAGSQEMGMATGLVAETAFSTNSSKLNTSKSSSAVPTSKREISSRSSTRCSKRFTSSVSRSRAVRARSGNSARRVFITSTEAERVMRGDRSSWLTSDANRSSWAIRC